MSKHQPDGDGGSAQLLSCVEITSAFTDSMCVSANESLKGTLLPLTASHLHPEGAACLWQDGRPSKRYTVYASSLHPHTYTWQ